MQEKTEAAGKPHVVRVELPDGKVRLLGVSAAARWLGCSKQALGGLAHGTATFLQGGKLDARAREAFPELFGKAAKTETQTESERAET